MDTERFTISALAENVPGVLQRLSIIFTRRKINIESLTVSESHKTGVSRFTFVVKSDRETIDKVLAQMRKVVELHDVTGRSDSDLIYKEIAFFRVRAQSGTARSELDDLAIEQGLVVNGRDFRSYVIEKVGTEDEIDQLARDLAPYGIEELVRSGRIAVARAA